MANGREGRITDAGHELFSRRKIGSPGEVRARAERALARGQRVTTDMILDVFAALYAVTGGRGPRWAGAMEAAARVIAKAEARATAMAGA